MEKEKETPSAGKGAQRAEVTTRVRAQNSFEKVQIQVSNAEFMVAVFGVEAHCWIASFEVSPKDATLSEWKGRACRPGAVPDFTERNTYYSVASFKEGADGRKLSQFAALHVLVLDDAESVPLGPSYLLETSKGNYQAGYRLKDPVTDIGIAKRLHEQLAKAGHIGNDPSGNNAARFVRLPVGRNNKYDEPFRHVLKVWSPELVFTLDELIAGLGLDAEYILHGGQPARPTSAVAGDAIPEGARNVTLTSLAGSMRRRGMTEEEILAALLVTNAKRCCPPLDEKDVATIAHSVARYAPSDVPNGKQECLVDPVETGKPSTAEDNPFPMELYDNAPGIVGDIARWITGASFAPRAEYAYACALVATACLIGPYVTYGNRGGKVNLYVTLVGETGSGKNESFDPMVALLGATDTKDCPQDFPASEAAMRRQLVANPNLLIRADELAHKLQSMQGKNNANGSALSRAILEAYNGARMPPKAYADDKKSLPAVENPFVQIIGGATDSLWKAFTHQHLEDGTLNRFLFVCLPDHPAYVRQSEPNGTVSKEFKDRLNAFAREGKRYDLLGYVPPGFGRRVTFDPEVQTALDELDHSAYEMRQRDSEYSGLYVRFAQSAAKVAAILAVGDGRLTVRMADFDHARLFVGWCIKNTYRKCREHMAEDELFELARSIVRVFKAKGETELTYGALLQGSHKLKHTYLPWKRDAVFATLLANGVLEEADSKSGKGKRYRWTGSEV